HALATEADAEVILVAGGEVLAVAGEEAFGGIGKPATVEGGSGDATHAAAARYRRHGRHGQRLDRAVGRRAEGAGRVDSRKPKPVHVRRVRGVASVAAPAGPAAGHQSPAAVAGALVASRRVAAGWAA